MQLYAKGLDLRAEALDKASRQAGSDRPDIRAGMCMDDQPKLAWVDRGALDKLLDCRFQQGKLLAGRGNRYLVEAQTSANTLAPAAIQRPAVQNRWLA